ncbi:hypothetical protein ACOJBO_10800 [Rhizobium beringeri]
MARIVSPLGTASPDALVFASKAAIVEQRPMQEADKTLTAAPASPPQTMSVEEPSRTTARMAMLNRKDPNALERIIGSRDIVSINFFERGLAVAKAICRIKILGRPATPPDYGTGF